MTPDRECKWQLLCDRRKRLGYESLSPDERLWIILRSLIDNVENGGLISYFYNSGADTLPECRNALRRLNALDVLEHVDRVAGLFGADVPTTVEERNRVLDSWRDDDARDALLEEVDEELMPLMRDLDRKLDAFLDSSRRPTAVDLES